MAQKTPRLRAAYQKAYRTKYREKLAEYDKIRWVNDKARRERARAFYLKKNYNITIDQYEIMFKMSNGLCWICGKPPKNKRLAVEHDHSSKRVRGLVCWRCNADIIGKNTVETAKKLVEYLGSDFDGRSL